MCGPKICFWSGNKFSEVQGNARNELTAAFLPAIKSDYQKYLGCFDL